MIHRGRRGAADGESETHSLGPLVDGELSLGVGQPELRCSGLDDVAADGQPVDDGGAEPRVGERFRPAGEALVGGNRDGVLLLPLRQDLDQQFGAELV